MKRRRRKKKEVGVQNFEPLRRGFTTGACAATAAKAAVILLLSSEFRVKGSGKIREVDIPFPDKSRVTFKVHNSGLITRNSKLIARASVIKDAGDDPDVTNGAEIIAEVRSEKAEARNNKAFQFTVHGSRVTIFGGEGVGVVTKPGLAVPVGEPAINPVPRKMIEKAVTEALTVGSGVRGQESSGKSLAPCPLSFLQVTISVPKGKEIAKKTMNARLGIIGGISILGTTGIVEPLSLDAYKQSISCAIDVAIASNCKELVFPTGRSSEKGTEKILNLSEESFILVGDHMGYALQKLVEKVEGVKQVEKVTIAGQFGKLSKLAAGHFETHCRDSNVELESLASLAGEAGVRKGVVDRIKRANTAREIFYILQENELNEVFKIVCERVKRNADIIVEKNFEIGCILVGYNNEIVERA